MNPSTSTPTPTELLNERDAADLLGLRPPTLRAWRFQRRGPAFVRLGRAVRYRRTDLLAYLDNATVTPGATPTL